MPTDPRCLLLVTGGSSGIGAAVLRSAPPGTRAVHLSRTSGDVPAQHVAADLATTAGIAAAADRLVAELDAFAGERVVVVHAAGTLQPIGFAGEVATDPYTASVILGSVAPQVLGHAVLGALVRHDATRREFVLVSSGAASSPYPGWSAYGAGKAAADQWVRTVGREQDQRAEEAGRRPVTVLAVAPGVVATGMQALIRDTDARDFPRVERFRELHEAGDLRAPDDVAHDLWALLDTGPATGSVLDLRDVAT